jgi:chorismate mutase/prephenate dehydratase
MKELRDEIDALDDQILFLLNRRAQAVIEVGKIKADQQLRFYVPEREVEILRRLTGANPGPFPNEALKSIYREIISASLALEKPLSVAFLGPRATFTHLACLKHFGESADYVAQINVSWVFDVVERGNADFGVVPIENSSEGIVSNTLDMFIDHNLLISGEILIEVAHDLLSVTGDIEHVKKVYSHPHAIAQCRMWLERNLGNAAVFDVESTARAAELAIDDPSAAAIAGEAAAKIYGLKCIRKRIQDNNQPHEDRIPPCEEKSMGISLLSRHGGAHNGRSGGSGPGRTPDARPVPENPRLLPSGDLIAGKRGTAMGRAEGRKGRIRT